MTSSFDNFGNVVGTPRDKLPDISDTNYLATEADLTEAVNKEIDRNIVDTKEFYDDMMKIEENRYKARDKRLAYIAEITGKVGELAQAIKAERATQKENDAKFASDRANRNAIVQLGDNAHTYNNTLLTKELEENENLLQPEVQEILAQLTDDLNPDVDLQTFLYQYDKNKLKAIFKSVHDTLQVDKSTNQLEGVNRLNFIGDLISNKIHVDAQKRGYDIESGRYEKQYDNIIFDEIGKLKENYSWALSESITSNRKAKRTEEFNNKIYESARNISKKPENGQDLTTFSDTKTGLIKQLSVEFFKNQPDAMSKAMDYYFDELAKSIEGGGVSDEHGKDVLYNLPYTDGSSKKKYDNIVEYAATLSPTSKHFGKVTNRIERLNEAIRSQDDTQQNKLKQEIADARKVHRDKYDKLIELDRKPTATEIYQIFSEFTGDPNSYKIGHRLKGDLPEWLKSALTGLDFSGNPEIANKLKYANLINSQSSVLRTAVAQYLKKKVNELTVEDEFLVQQLEQELAASITLGTAGVKSDFQIHIDKGLDPLSFIADEVKSLNDKLNAGDFDTFITDTSPKLAYQKQDMAQKYLDDPDSINDPNVKPGEALWLEKSIANVRSGGKLYPEVIEWWSEFKVMDDDGYFKRPREFMMQRLAAVGTFKDDPVFGKIIPKQTKFLEPEMFNYQTKNGLHGTLTVMTAVDDNGELYAKQVLDTFEAPEAIKGYHNLKGYDYHSGAADFGETIGNPFKISVDNKGNITQTDRRFVSIQTRDVTNRFGGGVYEQALKHPSMKLGRYGITGKELTEVLDANDGALKRLIPDGQKFDANFQDYLSFEVIRYKLNRMNSIRGMSVQGGEVTTKLTTFSQAEQEALNELFPRLKNYTMSQLHNLTPQIAKVILSDLEKGIKPEKPKKQTGRFKR